MMDGRLDMFEKYKGRIIATITFICAITLWNIIFYGYNNYSFNLALDLTYTLVVSVVVWWLASYYDKSKSLLKKLTKSEENYKKLLESTKYVFDKLNQVVFQTNGDGKITLLNPAWEAITGFAIEESLERNFLKYIYPDDCQLVIKKCELHKHSQNVLIQEEVRFRNKEGGFIWLEINSIFTYNSSNELISTVGTLTDITERKLSETELLQFNENLAIQSDKLAVISQMSAAIAHEVRNPLTSISGFLQLLRERKHLKQEYLDVIFSEMKRIELVLSEMLVLSKPQVVLFKKVDLSKIIDHVIALMSTESNMKSIELYITKKNIPIWVYGDENQLKQVFINIIKNAIEVMAGGGKIHIYIIMDCSFVSVYIKDEGDGIPEETLKTIGQPFYTTKEKGTGLGLTICFKIIENHKGKIHIISEVGVGTTFEVILPICTEDEKLYLKQEENTG